MSEETPLEVDVHAVKAMQDSDQQFLLIDCRESSEYEHVKIEGSVHIPMNETPARVAELEPHKEKPIVVHCHHGGRSMQVTNWLRSNGFPQAQNMAGGIDVWSQEIDSTLPRY